MFHFRCNRNDLTVDELADRLRNELLILIKVNHGVSYRQLPAFRSQFSALALWLIGSFG
jgi:hypothetical protein